MYLKSLEIQGFKSFPDKTILQFGDDITAIVGPNGSGKSNISDAIRWVMGEQSTKALRGAKMEDVIFGGTQKRNQVGFAEATLVLDNTDGAFRVDASEVMVTRRYYRSGESEYYINKQSARLRDINELFMDTGLGREGYSNISQGRIDEILSVKSTDRREIFEEAAGISKYRHRKEETERRLANTQDNLLRIGDKISELELQVEPLREQAEKAKKFLTLREELKGLEVALWLEQLDQLGDSARKAEEDYRSAAFILQQEHDALEQLYQQAEQMGGQLREKDAAAEQLRQAIAELDAQAQRLDGEAAVLRSNMENNAQNAQRVGQELEEQESRSGGLLQQIEQQNQHIAELETQLHTLDKQLEQAAAESEKLAASADDLTRHYLEVRSHQSSAMAELSGKQADLLSLESAISQAQERAGALRDDCTAAQERKQAAEEALANCTNALAAAREDVAAAKNRIDGYTLRMQSRAQRRDSLQKEFDALRVETDTIASRVRMFQEMEREYEGYSKAVRAVMQESQRGALKNVYGPVSKLIRTEERCAIAIETALGAAMQNIVVQSDQDGKAGIQMLKRRNIGRATFLPIGTIKGRSFQENGVEKMPGFVGIAADLVTYQPQFAAIISNLLGRIVVTQTLDDAIAIARQYQNRFKLVTLDGQVINAGGSMTGGAVSRDAGILSRANELRRLQKQLEQRRAQLKQTEDALQAAASAAAQVEFELDASNAQLREAEDAVLRLEGEEKQHAVLLEAINAAQSSSDGERRRVEQEMADAQARKTQLAAQSETLQLQLDALAQELERLTAGQADATEQSTKLADRVTALKMERAAGEAERTTAVDSVAQLRQLIQAMQGDRSQKTALLAEYEQERQMQQRRLEQTLQEQAVHREEAQKQRTQLQQALEARQTLEAAKTKAEKDAQNKNKDILSMERECARLEQKKSSAELEEKQIIDKLWDTYELTRSTAPACSAKLESTAAAQRRIGELKRKISALGTPNLGAIDEFARVNERYEYLTEQRDDVLNAKKDLEEIIRDITRQMTEIFVEEFAKIDQYFGQTFTQMFGGGKAALILEEPDEPLTCGIEIRVQPPGKQVKTITLLSGGEKAFVAIALYFAILQVRPTPFCMLDEIDAALDDRNVERFARYLRNLCQKTQFIIITHRRGTMEEADILYGVTMQEQGVSKILHLDLNQMEQNLGIVE